MLTARRIALIPLLAVAAVLLTGGTATAQTTTSGFVQVSIPNLAGQTPWFAENDDEGALAAPAANDLWLVGAFIHLTGPTAADTYFTPLVDHWNGQTWTLERIPEPKGATSFAAGDVSARGRNDVWISAEGTVNGKGVIYLLRWNGSSWRKLAVPRNVAYIADLTIGGPKDVWIIGGTDNDCLHIDHSATTRLLHWDGVGWHAYWSDNECKDFPDDFSTASLFASAADTGWRFGSFDGHDNPASYMEAACFGASCPSTPPTLPCQGGSLLGRFQGAVGTASDMWMVGGFEPSDDLGDPTGHLEPLVCHFDDGTWTDAAPPPLGYLSQSFYGAAVLPNGELWAAGERITQLGTASTTSIMRRAADGTWTDMGGINFEAEGLRELASISQIVHMPGTMTQMWAAGFREPEGKHGAIGGFLLYHP